MKKAKLKILQFTVLPYDVYKIIFGYLKITECFNLELVSRECQELVKMVFEFYDKDTNTNTKEYKNWERYKKNTLWLALEEDKKLMLCSGYRNYFNRFCCSQYLDPNMKFYTCKQCEKGSRTYCKHCICGICSNLRCQNVICLDCSINPETDTFYTLDGKHETVCSLECEINNL